MLHLIFFFFPQESLDIPEEKGRLDFNHRGTAHMELDSNIDSNVNVVFYFLK